VLAALGLDLVDQVGRGRFRGVPAARPQPALRTVDAGALLMQVAPPMGAPPDRPMYKEIFTWLVQPSGTTPATVTAVILGVVGTLAYAVFGSRR
jgi:hypothetical protein